MYLGYCASVSTIQNGRKWLSITIQHHAHIASWKKRWQALHNKEHSEYWQHQWQRSRWSIFYTGYLLVFTIIHKLKPSKEKSQKQSLFSPHQFHQQLSRWVFLTLQRKPIFWLFLQPFIALHTLPFTSHEDRTMYPFLLCLGGKSIPHERIL